MHIAPTGFSPCPAAAAASPVLTPPLIPKDGCATGLYYAASRVSFRRPVHPPAADAGEASQSMLALGVAGPPAVPAPLKSRAGPNAPSAPLPRLTLPATRREPALPFPLPLSGSAHANRRQSRIRLYRFHGRPPR